MLIDSSLNLRDRAGKREIQREHQREPQRFSLAPSGSLGLSLALPLACSPTNSGSLWFALWLSMALSGSPNLLTKSFVGSQGPCSALSFLTFFWSDADGGSGDESREEMQIWGQNKKAGGSKHFEDPLNRIRKPHDGGGVHSN